MWEKGGKIKAEEIKEVNLVNVGLWYKLTHINNQTNEDVLGYNFSLLIETNNFSKSDAIKIALDFLKKNWRTIVNKYWKYEELSGETELAGFMVYLRWSHDNLPSIKKINVLLSQILL